MTEDGEDINAVEAQPVRTGEQTRSFGNLLALLAGYKLLYFALIFTLLALLPDTLFNVENFSANFRQTQHPPASFARYFEPWDAQWYLYISKAGYEEGAPTAAFFPLWPFCIRALSYLTAGSTLVAALILSNVFSIFALALLHQYLAKLKGTRLADRTLLLMLAFPGAMFFCFPFTESLFLLMCVLMFASLSSEKYLKAGLSSFLAALTRPTGVLLALPMAVHALRSRKYPELATIAFPVAGMLCYFAIVYLFTGNAFQGFASQQEFVSGPTILKVINIPSFIKTVFQPLELHGVLNSAIDRAWLLWFFVSLWAIYKEDKTWFAFSLMMGLIPAMTVSMMSYTRYVLIVFPMFFITARFLSMEKRRWMFPLALVVLFSVQIFFLTRHMNYYWVA